MVRIRRLPQLSTRADQCCGDRCGRCFEQNGGQWPEAAETSIRSSPIRSGAIFVAQKTTRIFESVQNITPRSWLQKDEEIIASGPPVDTDRGVLLPVFETGAVLYQDLLCRNPEPLGTPVASERYSSPEDIGCEEAEKGDEDSDLFVRVLRQLEIQQEYDAMSVAGSIASRNSESSSFTEGLVTIDEEEPIVLGTDQLEMLLRQVRRRKLPEVQEALQLVTQTIDHLRDVASTLVRLPVPAGKLVVVGDLHGHLNDLLRLLETHGPPTPQNQYLFNGDFVDRGDWGPEVMMSLFCLRLLYPESVHLNRGNHECQQCTDRYGFSNQLMHVYPTRHKELYKLVHQAFDQLPLCHVVGNAVFVCHGGLPSTPLLLADIEAMPRGPPPRHGITRLGGADEQSKLFDALLWSDPASVTGPSPRGAGCRFGEEITKRFLGNNGLRKIVRSHECVPGGVEDNHSGLVTTVFSASNYGGLLDGNKARVVLIDTQCDVTPSNAWLEPYVKTQWTTKLNEEGTAFVKCREWDSENAADTQAIQTLQSRVGEDVAQWEQQPKHRAMDGVRRLIFLNRVQLLQAFEADDRDGSGAVTAEDWASDMAQTCATSIDFPWLELLPYLSRLDEDDSVPYMEFLLRYDNPFNRDLADRWCTAMLKHLSVEFSADIEAKFNSLDNSNRGRLAYNDLKTLIHSTIPDSLKVLHTQSVHIFALLRKLDPERKGHVTRDDFCRILKQAASRLTCCPQGHELAEWRCGMLQGHVHERTCDQCRRLILRSDMRRHCSTCDYDLCEVCAASGQLLEVTELRAVRFKKKPTLGGTKIQMQWDHMENAMRKLCEGHIDLRALFRHADTNSDGFVSREEFINSMASLWNGDFTLTRALWTLACEHCGSWHASHKAGTQIRRQASVISLQKGNGRLKVEDFTRCLAVLDFKNEPTRGSNPSPLVDAGLWSEQ